MTRVRYGIDLDAEARNIFGAEVDASACEADVHGPARVDVLEGRHTLEASEIDGFGWEPGTDRLQVIFFRVRAR